MKLTRRLFAGRAPLAVAALPAALHQTTGGGYPTLPPPGYPMDASRLGETEGSARSDRAKYDLFNAARRRAEEAYVRLNHQVNLLGGLDPDLFALRSIPVTQKVRIQVERSQARDEGHRTWVQALAKRFGVEW